MALASRPMIPFAWAVALGAAWAVCGFAAGLALGIGRRHHADTAAWVWKHRYQQLIASQHQRVFRVYEEERTT